MKAYASTYSHLQCLTIKALFYIFDFLNFRPT
jgi:hypothetical protein